MDQKGKEIGKKDVAEPAADGLNPELAGSLDTLRRKVSGGGFEIKDLKKKREVLERLADLVDPSISKVLLSIADDLSRCAGSDP